jgi:hypothetical protein
MILLVHSDKSKIKDFIMWADVEFAMQLELLETRRFSDQAVGILDLGELGQLAGVAAPEPLFVICHGGKGVMKTSLDREGYAWDWLGEQIGAALKAKPSRIELFACWAGFGDVGSRPIDAFAKGVGKAQPGIPVIAYLGATITNTMGTIGAREAQGGGGHGAVLVADDAKLGPNPLVPSAPSASGLDTSLRKLHTPQEKFNSFMQGNPKATARQKAIAAAEEASAFYLAFGSGVQQDALIYAVGSDRANPVTVTS